MSSSHVPTGNREVIDLVDSPVAPRTTRNSHHEVINLLDNDSVQVVLKEEEAWVVVAEDEEEAEVAEDVQMSSSAQKRRQTSQTMSASDGPAATVSSKIDRKSSAREGDPVHDSLIAATFKASREFVERNAMNGMDVVEDYVTDPSPARPTSCTRSHQRTLSATGGVKSFPIPPRQISTAGNQSSQSRPQVSATSIVRPSRFSPPVQILAAPPSNQVQTPTVTRSRSGNPSSAMAQSIDPPIGVNAPNTAATSNNNKLRATILTRSSTTMRR